MMGSWSYRSPNPALESTCDKTATFSNECNIQTEKSCESKADIGRAASVTEYPLTGYCIEMFF